MNWRHPKPVRRWYARDIGKKRRISNKIKALRRADGTSSYGYIKDPNNPKHWVIDEEAAQLSGAFFDMTLESFAHGTDCHQFEKEGILTPRGCWIQKGIPAVGREQRYGPLPSAEWLVAHLLYQQEYCGIF